MSGGTRSLAFTRVQASAGTIRGAMIKLHTYSADCRRLLSAKGEDQLD
jgi:hypothetical protein